MSLLSRYECPICSQPAPVILQLPYSDQRFSALMNGSPALPLVGDKPYEIRECVKCDLLFQTWMLVGKEAELIYTTDRLNDNPATISAQPVHALAHSAEEVLVVRQVFPNRIPQVLDFGCGWGKFASMALAYGCDVYGHEVNTGFAKFCASRGIKMISREEIPGREFDFINVDQVLEHVAAPARR
jgi:hypothetical protein